ncbi:MAG TPA: hypothetical protein DHV85_25385 [Candidatus Accumulibacter sp.]|nr:hypothetical protein [Accumulibacter sp.]
MVISLKGLVFIALIDIFRDGGRGAESWPDFRGRFLKSARRRRSITTVITTSEPAMYMYVRKSTQIRH